MHIWVDADACPRAIKEILYRAAERVRETLKENRHAPHAKVPGWHTGDAVPSDEAVVVAHNWDELRHFMWDYVGIVRDRERLDIALDRVRHVRATVEDLYHRSLINPEVAELRNIALLGELIVLCARSRQESRGLHYTTDFPHKAETIVNTDLQRHQELAGEIAWEWKGSTDGDR